MARWGDWCLRQRQGGEDSACGSRLGSEPRCGPRRRLERAARRANLAFCHRGRRARRNRSKAGDECLDLLLALNAGIPRLTDQRNWCRAVVAAVV